MARVHSRYGTLRPRDAADAGEILRTHRRALEPLGSGTKRTIGCPVDADPLDLSLLAGIVAYEPQELVLTARAATPMNVIDDALAANRQRLAFEPPDFGRMLRGDRIVPVGDARPRETSDFDAGPGQTLGGVLASNLAGSRRVSAGGARDHFLGFAAVTGSGVAFAAGGKVVKNVTGYDLPKLLAGSWGTLAVLTEVTVRVAPAPETETTLVLRADTPGEAVATLTRALQSAHDVSAAAFDPERGCVLRLEGFEASVEARVAGVLEALGRPDAERLDADESWTLWTRMGAADAFAASPVVWRISVPPSHAPRIVAEIEPDRYLLDWGGGLIWAAGEELGAERVRNPIRDGHATLWKAPLSMREATPVFQPLPAAVATVSARVKAALDPEGKLNPGRMVGASAGASASER
jgi:glycolate oxidase FAD binding subunit